MLALWTARLPGLARRHLPADLPFRTLAYTLVVAGIVAAVFSIPMRARYYSGSFVTERWDSARAARQAGVRDALVLVRESWESQLVVRMWALGISAPDGELLYRSVDACRLDEAIARLERRGARGPAAVSALRPLLADSALVRTYRLPAGTNVRVQPGREYSARCQRRIAETGHGVLPLAPLLLARDGNVYARDLHERDSLLLRAHPGRPVFLLVPERPHAQARPRFHRVSLDSMRAEWRDAAAP